MRKKPFPVKQRQKAEKLGRMGELIALWWLRFHGWHIVKNGKRAKTKQGEIDIIARRGGILAFIEVKTRRSAQNLDDAIDKYRLRRVAAAVHSLAPRLMRPDESIRIDVILWCPWHWPHHIINVWYD
ncbi:YraN family protein [Zymomonas mobilis]|uniref:YraN family protein n=1 Tax=Zymomonas mobilis TaxID=542 RepID=UPI0039E7BD32